MDDVRAPVGTRHAAPTIASVWAELSGSEMTDATLEWPADVFALVGSVLSRTHAYRFAVSPPMGRRWPPRGAESSSGSERTECACCTVPRPEVFQSSTPR